MAHSLHNPLVILCFVLPALPCFLGCGDSRSAQMEAMRKMARDSTSGQDEDEPAPLPVVATPAPVKQPVQAASPAQIVRAATVSAHDAPAALGPATTAPARVSASAVSDTKSPPTTPLSEEQRRQISIDNLTAIAGAMVRYVDEHKGMYPPSFISNVVKNPLLSWRVEILPYLGYMELYAQFRLDESWDSEHNRKLIEQIPSVYQSPDRFDQFTNYIVPVNSGTAFFGPVGKSTRRWEDGAKNTVIVVEADDSHAVPWTQPLDLAFDPRTPKVGLGNLRSDGFFSVWGGGEVALVPKEVGGQQLKALFTVDGGETIVASQVKRPALASLGGLAASLRPAGLGTSSSPAVSVASSATTGVAATENSQGTAGMAPAAMVPNASVSIASADAQQAYSAGQESDAIRLYYGAIVMGQSSESWLYQFQWIPALSRPTPVVRYGIGIEWIGPNAGRAQAKALNTLVGQTGQVEKTFRELAGSLGDRVLAVLREQPVHTPFLIEAEQAKPQNRIRRSSSDDVGTPATIGETPSPRLAPGVQFLGVESERVLLAVARKHEVDVLVLFQINEKRNSRSIDLRLSLFDAVRGKEIYRSDRLNNLQIRQAKTDLLADDPTVAFIAQLKQVVKERLTPAPVPPQLRQKHAAARVHQLAEQKQNSPLRAMAEIQYYRHRELIEVSQVVEAYSAFLDKESALTLVAGSSSERQEVLSSLLPEVPDAY